MVDNETTEQVTQETPVEQQNPSEMVENQGEIAPEMVENQTMQPEAAAAPVPTPIPEHPSSKHFKAIREEKERAQRERDQLMQMLQEERARNGQRVESEHTSVEDDFGIDENSFAEGKDLKKVVKELQDIKKEMHQYKQKTAIEVTEARLRTEYPDFSKVFSDDNIEVLKAEHPEIAATILSSNADPYSVAKSAYKMIKNLGIHVEDNSAPDREKVQKNLSKPRPAASVSPRQGSTPLTQVNEYGYAEDLSDERAAALRKEIELYSR